MSDDPLTKRIDGKAHKPDCVYIEDEPNADHQAEFERMHAGGRVKVSGQHLVAQCPRCGHQMRCLAWRYGETWAGDALLHRVIGFQAPRPLKRVPVKEITCGCDNPHGREGLDKMGCGLVLTVNIEVKRAKG